MAQFKLKCKAFSEPSKLQGTDVANPAYIAADQFYAYLTSAFDDEQLQVA